MNESGFTLDIPRTRPSKNVLAQNKSLTFFLAVIILMAVAATIALNATASTAGSLAPELGSVDAARWEAMGRFFQARESLSASLNNTLIDGWDKNHEYYRSGSSTPSGSRSVPIDGWDKSYEYYKSASSGHSVIDGWDKNHDYYQDSTE